mgnify:CR=1 FL=1
MTKINNGESIKAYSQSEEFRVETILDEHKNLIMNALSKKFLKLFRAIENYDVQESMPYTKEIEEEMQDRVTEIVYMCQEIGITEEDARMMYDRYTYQVEDYINECR